MLLRVLTGITNWHLTQLVKVAKPTGHAKCPPLVTCVHKLEQLLGEEAGTCELSDPEYAEIAASNNEVVAIEVSSDDNAVPAKVLAKAWIACPTNVGMPKHAKN